MKKKILTTLWDYLAMTFAVIVFTLAWEGFMIPNGMSAGGLMGICTVIEFATNGAIMASYSYIAINTLLIVIAVFAFGIGFGFKTIYCILAETVALKFFADFDWLHAVEGNFLYVKETLMIPVIAGVLEAVGVGIIIRRGGSTGGTDIIALMVNKYWPVSLSRVFLLTDIVIVCSMLLLPGRAFSDLVYGFVMMVTFAFMIDYVVVGDKGTIQLMVFSHRYSEIADYITGKMDRGVTVLKAQGWFTKKDRNVLLLLMRKNELSEITKVIKEFDNRAFMSVTQVGGVYGEGFEEIKAGIRRKKTEEQ
ncbi:MAG: YitT family protein [Bacteroidales bacterium]|nr:YitT family protein [Bacteroidales bacterium]